MIGAILASASGPAAVAVSTVFIVRRMDRIENRLARLESNQLAADGGRHE